MVTICHRDAIKNASVVSEITNSRLENPPLMSVYNETSHFIYSVEREDVDAVIINGKIMMERRSQDSKRDTIIKLIEKTKYNLLEFANKSL